MSDRPEAIEEPFLELPAPRELLTPPLHVRSTLIASSLRSLREHGVIDEYLSKVDARWKDALLESVAGTWLPLDAGIAHYGACDALSLSATQHYDIGREVGERVNGTFLGMLLRTAKNAGATPWTALAQARRFYERLFDGGAICVGRSGPKDAKWELVVNPLTRFAYFRDGARGMWASAIELFCRKAYVSEIGRTDTSMKLKIAWA
jgi:hypothetical protein